MNRKQLAFILLALVFMGSAGLILVHRHHSVWTAREARVGEKLLPGFRLNDVASVHIKGSFEFNIVRTDGIWRMPERFNYPVDYLQLKETLMRIRDVRVAQSEIVGPSQRGRVQLEAPGLVNGGLLLEFKDAGGAVIGSLLAGKRHVRPKDENTPFTLKGAFDGRYVLIPSDPGNVLLISDDLSAGNPEPGSWLARDFFRVDNIKSIAHTAPVPANSWKTERETVLSSWMLADSKPNEALDRAAAAGASEILYFPAFTDIQGTRESQSHCADLAKPHLVTVTTFNGLTYNMNVSDKRQDGSCLLTVDVRADIPAQRTMGKGERPEEKASLDREFAEETTKLREKVAKEKQLASWIYVVDSKTVEPYICDRAQLLQKPSALTSNNQGEPGLRIPASAAGLSLGPN
jgi:hypothetical protein